MTTASGCTAVDNTRALLRLYADPGRADGIGHGQWTTILGAARRARALGHLAVRLRLAGVMATVPEPVAAHFESADRVIRRQRQRLHLELRELGEAVDDLDAPVVLLKGAAYEALKLPLAAARVASDVDILVRPEDLHRVEDRLKARGWVSIELNAYDERYYREWSHEIPALSHPSRSLEVDVHHSIAPGLRGNSPAVRALFERSMPCEWRVGRAGRRPRPFQVLDPADQLLHLAVHTFASSDLAGRLREVMDFDLLYRIYCAPGGPVDPGVAMDRASSSGTDRAFWWALHFARRWLGTPVEPALLDRTGRPGAVLRSAMNWACDRSMLPGITQRRTRIEFAAELALLTRYQWHRLPLRLLLPHVVEKARRRVLDREAAS